MGSKTKQPRSVGAARNILVAKNGKTTAGISSAPTDRTEAHLAWCLKNRPDAEQNPTRAWLVGLYIKRLREIAAIPAHVRLFALGLAHNSVLHDLDELRKWAFPTSTVAHSNHNAGEMLARELAKSGIFTSEGARKMSTTILSRTGGRPTSRRRVVVEAVELKHKDKKKTWRQIVAAVCDCGKASHNESCLDTLKNGLKEFRRLQKKYSAD